MKIQHRRLGLKEMKGHIAVKIRRFEEMIKESIKICKYNWDSDGELSGRHFQVSQQIDYL